MHLRFNRFYFLSACLLFVTEVLIGAYMHDAFIRPYVGDFLVVILLYCGVRSFWDVPVWPCAAAVLTFAYIVEPLQYFGLADRLGFSRPSLMRVILGSSFEWGDIIAYTVGIFLVVSVERLRTAKPGRLSVSGREAADV